MNTVGPNELKQLPFLAGALFDAPAIPFSDDVLRAHENTHILVFTPRVPTFTLVVLRDIFGMDPSQHEPCTYNQDWYLKEDFANTPPDGKWHLVRKEVIENMRAKRPEEIEAALSDEQFPSAITCAFTFFAWYHLKGEVLWKHDFLLCSDRVHNGDRIYVGPFKDPAGINTNGF